jgi:hypothetical protein
MITLDENHVYRDGDKTIPGVTDTLKAAGLIDTRWFDDYSRERGSLVHAATALFDRGELDEDSLDPVLRPYLDGWTRFLGETGFQPDRIEQIVFNPLHRYAGTLDRTGRMGGKGWLLDIKSGAAQAWTALQTAAYAACLPGTWKRGSVELPGDGTYRLTEYKDRTDFAVFCGALNVAKWKQQHGG